MTDKKGSDGKDIRNYGMGSSHQIEIITDTKQSDNEQSQPSEDKASGD